jgi:hypothetical protein
VTRTIAHISALRPLKDSVNWRAIPLGTPMVAGYVPPSGFAWPDAAWARFAGSIEVRITPSAFVHGLGIQVLDVEPGDASAAQAPGWAHAQRALGQIPTIYTSASNWQNVINAFNAAHEPQPEYWIASYPGGGQVLPSLDGITAVAHQFADPATSGGDWDSSVVADVWPGVDTGVGPDMSFDLTTPIPGTNGQAVQDALALIVNNFEITANAFYKTTIPDAFQSILTQLAAIEGALSQEEADLLAALKTVPVANVDPAALAAALEAGGFPAAFVKALLAVLNKVATGGTNS